MKKKKGVKNRSWVAEMMIHTVKGQTFKDRKKEANRKACRGRVRP